MFDSRLGVFGNDGLMSVGRCWSQFAEYTNTEKVISPVIAVGETITMVSNTYGATIYYTTDGSTPDSTDIKYTGAIDLPYETTEYIAIAIKTYLYDSDVCSYVYTVEVE